MVIITERLHLGWWVASAVVSALVWLVMVWSSLYVVQVLREWQTMDLILLVLVLAMVGFLVYLIITHIQMPPIFSVAIQAIVVVAVILYLLRRFGGSIPNLLE